MLDDFLPPTAKTGEDLNTNSYVLLYKSCTSKRDEMRMVLLEPMNHIRCVEACEDLNVFWEENPKSAILRDQTRLLGKMTVKTCQD